jgi:signal transduction histidine kinase
MIGAIAHQWRQPLATLGATIQSIRMAWEENCIDDAFLESAEADAQMQLNYMSDTIEDFRNFFSHEKVIERFDVRERINEVVLLVAPQFANSGVSLQVVDNSPGRGLEIKGYQNEFKQSVLNLVSNSFDAIIAKAHGRSRSDGTVDDCDRSLLHHLARRDGACRSCTPFGSRGCGSSFCKLSHRLGGPCHS